MNKNLTLAIVLVLILISIFYVESKKVHQSASDTQAVTVTQATSTPVTASRDGYLSLAEKASKYKLANEITTPDGFVNTPADSTGSPQAIKISDYIGKKVVLIDFWTYSCINCQRTIPYLEGWYKKYEDEGLVIIGIHTPEFEFEKDYNNVKAGVEKLGITFPVVLDNDYSTWNAYNNHYWPHKYLIDIDGYVTYDHIGEGGYDESEQQIQAALKERAQVLGTGQVISTGLVNPADATTIETASPETYFGWSRNEFLGNGVPGRGGIQTYKLPTTFKPNTLYLGGSWDLQKEYAETTGAIADFAYHYKAKNVYLVASAATPVTLTITQDGKVLKTITVSKAELYTLVQNPGPEEHDLQIHVEGKGLEAFTFTFG